jgi:predicted GH43/DUF377 family glycosyl hydrolase
MNLNSLSFRTNRDPARGFSIRSMVVGSLRRILARFGFVFFRAALGVPPTLRECLELLAVRFEKVFCFDSEPAIQYEVFGLFSPENVTFITQPIPETPGEIGAGPATPAGRFLVEVNAECFDPKLLQRALPWILDGETVLIRASLGFFWSGKGDLGEMARFMHQNGFELFDTLDYVKLHLLNAPLGQIILVFVKQRRATGGPAGIKRQRRVAEALAFLSPPIARSTGFVRLAGHGSFGFAGGVYNPGAVAEGERVLLLARAERTPWAILRWNQTAFLSGCQPVLVRLDETSRIAETRELTYSNREEMSGSRVEDFRLFRYRNQLFANHSRFRATGGPPGNGDSVRFKSLVIDVGISKVDVAKGELTFLGTPALDRPMGRIEKNWVLFENEQQLYLIYSFHPYHLLRANSWPELGFETVMQCELQLPFASDEIDIRNSINPVEYDRDHLLHMVHKAYSDKQYVFWAVLLEKKSLMPVKISRCPLVRGWLSAPATILYACSVLVRGNEILVFAGINDSSMGFWRIPQSELDANWIPLNRSTE